MTDVLPRNVITFKTRSDCQGEQLVVRELKASVMALNPPGVNLDELMELQAKERRIKRAKDAWIEFRNAYAVLMDVTQPDDPSEHAIKWIEDMRGARHD